MTICLRMTAYSSRERKTRSMQARSQTSSAVTVLLTGIRVLDYNFGGGYLSSQLPPALDISPIEAMQ